MQLTLRNDLPFTKVKVSYRGTEIEVLSVLVDTGSAHTILAADITAQIGIIPNLQDPLHIIRGVGGTEAVFVYARLTACRLDGKAWSGSRSKWVV